MNKRADYLAERFKMTAHPEGGFYAPSFRSDQFLPVNLLKGNWKNDRTLYSSILFLLVNNTFSAWHKIASDEIWHHYEGDDILIHIIHNDGNYTVETLSRKEGKENFTAIVHGGCWFASECVGELGYALAGCSLAPGFDFEDFELGNARALINRYPQHKALIEKYVR